MSDRVQLQVFYEIAMELSPEATLQNTARKCLSAYLHKLGCMAGMVLRAENSSGEERLTPVAAMPQNLLENEIYTAERDKIREMVKSGGMAALLASLPIKGLINDGHFYLLTLKDFGALLLIKKGEPFDITVLHNIKRLNDKLAQACIAGLYTDRLEATVQARTRDLQETNRKLTESIANIKTLTGLLPICASCKKIRDDKGYWNQIETYVREHTEAEFTHGLCPACMHKLYPEYSDPDEKK